jgi:hypothetical protein
MNAQAPFYNDRTVEPRNRAVSATWQQMPDHLKYHLTSGVETTTCGFGNSVGMAECATLHGLDFTFLFIVGVRRRQRTSLQ